MHQKSDILQVGDMYVMLQTTTMAPVTADSDKESADLTALSNEQNDDELSNKHVLRQAQLSRELQQLNEMLADKQQLAGQMMKNDAQLETVKLQYEVSSRLLLSHY